MAMEKKNKSSQKAAPSLIIEIPDEERNSTHVHFNDDYTKDKGDLSYRKISTEQVNDSAERKKQEIHFFEKIDDGRLSLRSTYGSSASINTLGNTISEETTDSEENLRSTYGRSESISTLENIRGLDETITKEYKLQREDSIFLKKDSPVAIPRSVFKTSDAGNGMEIILPSYLLPDGVEFCSNAWSPEERGQFLKDKNFSCIEKFQTDIFHIYKTNSTDSQSSNRTSKEVLYYPDVEPSNITIRVCLPEMSQMNGLCLTFQAHVRYKKKWKILEAIYQQDIGTVTFNTNQMDSFFIVSTPRNDKLIITPAGYEYVSEADSRIKIDFPANSVSQDEEVNVQVIPVNRKTMAKKIESNPRNCFILAISECLSVRHSLPSFEKPVEIQLPVDDIPGIESKNVKWSYGVFKREKNTTFRLTDIEVKEKNGVPTIAVSSFSGYVITKSEPHMLKRLEPTFSDEIEIAIGEKMICKILFFISDRRPNSMSVMLECTQTDNVEDVTQRRKEIQYELVRRCPSPDFVFPVNQRIRVDVGGRFSLTKHIGKAYYFLTFCPIAKDNFRIFPVNKNSAMENAVYGIITFKEDNGSKQDLHAIHYDPWSSRGMHTVSTARKPPLECKSAPPMRLKDEVQEGFTPKDFFSDKALLVIAQSLSPESMFEVAIHLDIDAVRIKQITNDNTYLTTSSKYLQLLKIGLDNGNNDTKIQRLSSALRDSDENALADKIEELYQKNMPITKGNLKTKNTVVTKCTQK